MANIRKKFFYPDAEGQLLSAPKKKLQQFLSDVLAGKADASTLLEFSKPTSAKAGESVHILNLADLEEVAEFKELVEDEIAADSHIHSRAGGRKSENTPVAPPSTALTGIVEELPDGEVQPDIVVDGSGN